VRLIHGLGQGVLLFVGAQGRIIEDALAAGVQRLEGTLEVVAIVTLAERDTAILASASVNATDFGDL
jgi:hypothetical protein